MTPVTNIVVLLVILAAVLASLRMGLLGWLAARPLVTLAWASFIGITWASLGFIEPAPEDYRQVARFALAFLGFFAALQCRVSRLQKISPAAFRLAIFAPIVMLVIVSLSSFIIVPGLGLLSAVLIAAALVMGGAPSIATPLLTAPIEPDTKAAARLEGAAVLAAALPIVVLVEAGAMPSAASLDQEPLFRAFAGFAIGGTIGLLSGRLIPLARTPLPVLPVLVVIASMGMAIYTGFDPIMCAIAAGLLFSEEAPLKADVRTRLWRVAEGIITPLALLAFGFLMAPFLIQIDLLICIAAAAAIIAARVSARFIALQRLPLPLQDRNFLIWFGGAPGAASALFLLSLVASPAIHINDKGLTLGVISTMLGIALTRVQSRPLTSRLVQATARARRRRYSPA